MMTEKDRKKNPTLTTSKFRASYQHLLEPWAAEEGQSRRYSVQAIFDKDDPFVKKLRETVRQVAIDEFGERAPRLLRNGKLKNPLRDGDDEFPDQEEYKGKIFANFNGDFEGKRPPGLVNQRLKSIRKMDNPEEIFYSGCYARAEIRVYAFTKKSKGVTIWLLNVQKMAEGEPLGGARNAEDVFDEVEDEDFDTDSEWDDDEAF